MTVIKINAMAAGSSPRRSCRAASGTVMVLAAHRTPV